MPHHRCQESVGNPETSPTHKLHSAFRKPVRARPTTAGAAWRGVLLVVGPALGWAVSLAGCAEDRPVVRAGAEGPAPEAGLAVKNLQRDGHILIGGEVGPAGLEDLYRAGVRTIIDVRNEPGPMAAEAQRARGLGMNYVAVPMASNAMTADQARAILEAMNRHRQGDVLIHCGSGNRAAGAYGLYLGATGQCPVQEALERAKKAGLRNDELARAVRAHLATRPAGETSTRPSQ